MKKRSLIALLLVLSLILPIFAMPVFAEEGTDTLIDTIIIELEDGTTVAVGVVEYMQALRRGEKSDLYNYLKGDLTVPKVVAFGSADKYMDAIEYMKALRRNDNDITKAIEAAPALDDEVVTTFYSFEGFDENGEAILKPIVEPSNEVAEKVAEIEALINEIPQVINEENAEEVKTLLIAIDKAILELIALDEEYPVDTIKGYDKIEDAYNNVEEILNPKVIEVVGVSAINGKVTVEFNKEVTEVPEGLVVLKDGEALELEADAFAVVEGKVEIAVPEIEATFEEQSIVYSVKLGDAEAVAAEAVVIPAKEVVVETVAEIEDITVEFGTALEDLELPETITLILSNEKTAEVAVTWTCEDYNGTVAGEYTFVGSYELPEGVTGEKPAATVKVVVNKVIEEVTVPTTITIVLGEEPILPKTVEVIYEDGTEGEAAVEWNLEEVDFSVVGTKAITGTVVGTELEVTITVDVKSVEDLEAAVAAVKTKAEADNQDEFNAALKAPVLNIKNIKDDYLADYKTAIADAFVVESVADIQALVDGVNAEKAAEEAAEKAAEEAAKAAQLEAIKSATTVSELRKALGMDGNEDEHPVVFDHILNTTADLNAYRTAILKADPADLEAVQTIIDEVNYAKVETAVIKLETSKAREDLQPAKDVLAAVISVHPEFDTAEEGEKTFDERIADIEEVIVAAEALADAIDAVNEAEDAEALLTALQEEVLELEEDSVDVANKDAYFAALEALKLEEGYEAFTTPEEIQAFVNKVNADVIAEALADAIAAVNEAEDAEALLTALQEEVLELEEDSVDVANKDAYFAALEALKLEEGYEAFTTPEEIQAFVNKVNADEAQALIDAVNEATTDDEFINALKALDVETIEANKEAYFAAFEALVEADEDFIFNTVKEMEGFVAEIDKVEAVKAATTEDDMIAALVAVENANFINLRPAAVRTDVATLMIAYITEEDNDEMIFLADVNAVLEAQIDLAAELLGNLNAAETNTEILAALKAIQEAGFEITANLELVDSVVVAREAEGFTGFRSIQEVLALAE